MKSFLSIAILVLMGFVEAYSLHHSSNHQEACLEEIPHFCLEDHHHHCGVCDHYVAVTTLHAADDRLWILESRVNYLPYYTNEDLPTAILFRKGRSPPLV